ncbi:MAG: DUF6340 family protein [Cyclobacteriaceae bacterium]|nr:DUF6340 family protein [Cyclobacteriaceae bacterium]
MKSINKSAIKLFLLKKAYILFFLVLIFVNSSCRSTRYVTFNAVLPAEITFDPRIKSFLIVDHTLQEKKNLNIIEGVITGEKPGDDKKGVQKLMLAFKRQVETSDRFRVAIHPERIAGNSILNVLPDPTDWEVIEQLAEENDTDLVIFVESFDSNYDINPINNIAHAQTSYVEAGLRIYDPVTRTIVDEQLFRQRFNSPPVGNTPLGVIRNMSDRSDAVAMAAEMAGMNYAQKISPSAYRLRRDFYSRGKKDRDVARGARYADVNNWQEAKVVWEKALETTPKRKDAGRLCYDIAVAYEVLGDLDMAHQWAGRSFTDYKNKKGREYAQLINRRKNSEAILRDQMEER